MEDVMVNSDWLSVASACEEEIMQNAHRKAVEKYHKQAIVQSERGFWTYVGSGQANRKRVLRKTKEDLLDYLYEYYQAQAIPPMSLGDAIDRFIQYKLDVYDIDTGTATRNRFTSRFFSGIADRPIASLTADEIRTYIHSKAPFKKYEIKAALQLLHGTFAWALEHDKKVEKDVSYNIKPREFFKECAGQHTRTVAEKIFTPEEIDNIKAAAHEWTPNMRAFAILLSIETGMRAGEIVSLKWEDIKDKVIHIHTQQQLVQDEYGHRLGFEELPYTKDERTNPHDGRYFPLTAEIRAILDEIRPLTGDGKYVLAEDSEWITKTSYEKYLKRQMKRLGYSITNNHAFRMSLNNNVLIPKRISDTDRAQMLGHSVETNVRYYSGSKAERAAELGDVLDDDQSETA